MKYTKNEFKLNSLISLTFLVTKTAHTDGLEALLITLPQ